MLATLLVCQRDMPCDWTRSSRGLKRTVVFSFCFSPLAFYTVGHFKNNNNKLPLLYYNEMDAGRQLNHGVYKMA